MKSSPKVQIHHQGFKVRDVWHSILFIRMPMPQKLLSCQSRAKCWPRPSLQRIELTGRLAAVPGFAAWKSKQFRMRSPLTQQCIGLLGRNVAGKNSRVSLRVGLPRRDKSDLKFISRRHRSFQNRQSDRRSAISCWRARLSAADSKPPPRGKNDSGSISMARRRASRSTM